MSTAAKWDRLDEGRLMPSLLKAGILTQSCVAYWLSVEWTRHASPAREQIGRWGCSLIVDRTGPI